MYTHYFVTFQQSRVILHFMSGYTIDRVWDFKIIQCTHYIHVIVSLCISFSANRDKTRVESKPNNQTGILSCPQNVQNQSFRSGFCCCEYLFFALISLYIYRTYIKYNIVALHFCNITNLNIYTWRPRRLHVQRFRRLMQNAPRSCTSRRVNIYTYSRIYNNEWNFVSNLRYLDKL